MSTNVSECITELTEINNYLPHQFNTYEPEAKQLTPATVH